MAGLMGGLGLFKTFAFSHAGPVPTPQSSGFPKDPVDRARADGNNILVEHHKGGPTVSLCWMFAVKSNNGFPLPVLKPCISRNPSVMVVYLPVALLPVIKLARSQFEPTNKVDCGNARFLRPVKHKIHDSITNVMGDPDAAQISPRLFLSATCSSMSSERTSFFLESFSSSSLTFFSNVADRGSYEPLKALAPFSKNWVCQR